MMRATIALWVGGCIAAPEPPVLRIEPATFDVDVELGVSKRTQLTVFADDTDITKEAKFSLDGKPLGSVDAAGFVASGSLAGRAQMFVQFDGQTIVAPVHVTLHGRRDVGTPADTPEWFRNGTETIVDASLEPGDGAVLPPNLGRLDVHFGADDFDDVHELAVTSPDVDIRVYTFGAAGPRTIALTPDEWYAISESNRGNDVDVAVRTTRIIKRDNIHTAKAKLHIADLPFAREILFTGRTGTEMPQLWSYDVAASHTIAANPNKPAGSCIGCHVAASKDGRYLAAGGSDGTTGGGIVLDAWSREPTTPFIATNIWTSATYDSLGGLFTTVGGRVTYRDGTTATPIANLMTEAPANQPAMSNHTGVLAYVAGPIDPVSMNPTPSEIRMQGWSILSVSLLPGAVFVPAVAGDSYKLPDWSPDDRWLMYTRVRANDKALVVRPTNGELIPIELVHDADYGRFASKFSEDAEPMAWIIMKREVPVGVRNQDKMGQLWATAFFPNRGVASRPFYLPNQRADVAVLHAPIALQ